MGMLAGHCSYQNWAGAASPLLNYHHQSARLVGSRGEPCPCCCGPPAAGCTVGRLGGDCCICCARVGEGTTVTACTCQRSEVSRSGTPGGGWAAKGSNQTVQVLARAAGGRAHLRSLHHCGLLHGRCVAAGEVTSRRG